MNTVNYKSLFFADTDRPTLDITKPQTTVGITIKVGDAFITWAYQTGDFGGEPESLDCTPLSALVQMNKTGIQALENWTVDYYANDDDYQTLENQRKSNTLVDIVVTLPSGTQLSNKGHCTANHMTGLSTNSMVSGHATFELSNSDGWTYTPATPVTPASTLNSVG